MKHSIVKYDQQTTHVYKGFASEEAALRWAEENCEPDPRWYLTSTPEGAAIVDFQNAPEAQ